MRFDASRPKIKSTDLPPRLDAPVAFGLFLYICFCFFPSQFGHQQRSIEIQSMLLFVNIPLLRCVMEGNDFIAAAVSSKLVV
jgi:hypothetical protein